MTTMKTGLNGSRTIARELHKDSGNGLFDIIIRANGFELKEHLREAVARKIGRVRQYEPRAFRARVTLDREHMKAATDQYRVTVRYEIPGKDLIAEHRAYEPLAAVDLVSEKIERRLRKRKTARLASRIGRKGRPCRIAEFCDLDESYPSYPSGRR